MGCYGIEKKELSKEEMKKFLLDNWDLVDKESEEIKEMEEEIK